VLLAISVIFVLSALAAVLWMASQAKDLKVARRRAEEASRAKSEFLANMSHEIRTPLNGVVAMADALTRARLAPREREMVEVIRSSGVTLERLLSDILDSAKIEAGQIALERSVFDLGEAVRGVAALYRPSADQKGVALRLEVGPAAEGPVEGDLVRLRQVLSNLISNALKFTETGSVTVTASAVDAERMRFTVKDTGCGFDEEQKARIFGRFQQADGSITRRFGGTGLGLSISRDLVELMGGGLECRSRPGEGAEFWFELPLARVKASASAPAETARSDDFPFPARVLLADDHPANRKVIEIMLAETPAELVVVEDGRQALEAVRREPFDLVLMDMQMPVMDGLTATAAIRALERQDNRKRTPIIMLTANAMPEHVEAGRAAGADGHLSKPITFAGLIDGLSAVMGSAERSHAPAAA
jgi:CheY-like chemotaxis protein/nitrogen-specific signal transduction histidine kinase